MSGEEPEVDFFISRTGADAAWAKWVDWQLRAAGYSTRLQDYDFAAGDNVVLQMHETLTRAHRVVAIWSAAYFDSRYCPPEQPGAIAAGYEPVV